MFAFFERLIPAYPDDVPRPAPGRLMPFLWACTRGLRPHLAVLTLLCVWMYFALRDPPRMNEAPKGAGAGKTGLSNEYMGLGGERPQTALPTGAAPATGSPAPK